MSRHAAAMQDRYECHEMRTLRAHGRNLVASHRAGQPCSAIWSPHRQPSYFGARGLVTDNIRAAQPSKQRHRSRTRKPRVFYRHQTQTPLRLHHRALRRNLIPQERNPSIRPRRQINIALHCKPQRRIKPRHREHPHPPRARPREARARGVEAHGAPHLREHRVLLVDVRNGSRSLAVFERSHSYPLTMTYSKALSRRTTRCTPRLSSKCLNVQPHTFGFHVNLLKYTLSSDLVRGRAKYLGSNSTHRYMLTLNQKYICVNFELSGLTPIFADYCLADTMWFDLTRVRVLYTLRLQILQTPRLNYLNGALLSFKSFSFLLLRGDIAILQFFLGGFSSTIHLSPNVVGLENAIRLVITPNAMYALRTPDPQCGRALMRVQCLPAIPRVTPSEVPQKLHKPTMRAARHALDSRGFGAGPGARRVAVTAGTRAGLGGSKSEREESGVGSNWTAVFILELEGLLQNRVHHNLGAPHSDTSWVRNIKHNEIEVSLAPLLCNTWPRLLFKLDAWKTRKSLCWRD
ncbi:hypothetical protein B0H11DRAFT_1932322 [Mycena galericulata]|nr:hypothetical protein B0H11DRAFT_1932322 [Mycena galericulata]